MSEQTPRTKSFPVRSNSFEQYGYLRQSHEELELALSAAQAQIAALEAKLKRALSSLRSYDSVLANHIEGLSR